MLQVVVEHARHLLGKGVVVHVQAGLVVEAERTHVEVGGADRDHLLVDDEELVVHHRRQVFVDLHAGLQQRAPFGLGGQAHGVGIDVLARHQDAHGHAALARRDQCLVDQLVRHEIRGLQVDGMLGRGNAHQVHQVHALAAAGGR